MESSTPGCGVSKERKWTSEERIPIRPDTSGHSPLILLVLTVFSWAARVWIEWDWADGDSAPETFANILMGLPIGWLLGIIVAIIAVGVSGVIKDYIDLKKARAEVKDAEDRAKDAEDRAAKAEARAAKAEAKLKEMDAAGK